MLNKRKKTNKQKKASTPPSETEDFEFVIQRSLLSIVWLSPLWTLLLPEYKSAIDGVVKDVAQLRLVWNLVKRTYPTDTLKRSSQSKITFLESRQRWRNISRRPSTYTTKADETICASKDYWKITMKHGMKRKRKLRISSSKNSILNLLQKLNVLIAQPVLGGKMELQNRERSFVSLQVIKQRRLFSRRQGKSNPKV